MSFQLIKTHIMSSDDEANISMVPLLWYKLAKPARQQVFQYNLLFCSFTNQRAQDVFSSQHNKKTHACLEIHLWPLTYIKNVCSSSAGSHNVPPDEDRLTYFFLTKWVNDNLGCDWVHISRIRCLITMTWTGKWLFDSANQSMVTWYYYHHTSIWFY